MALKCSERLLYYVLGTQGVQEPQQETQGLQPMNRRVVDGGLCHKEN